LTKPGEVKVDGVLKEWGNPESRLTHVIQGAASGAAMSGFVAYDDQYIYVAGEGTDSRLVRTAAFSSTEDHAELALVFPDDAMNYRTVYEVELYAGEPGKSAGQVKARGAGVVSGAKIVEAPSRGGYTFEAQIPWSLFPPASHTRVGLRGALRYYDSNGSGIACVLSTADKGPGSSLPFAPTAPEQALVSGFLREKGISGQPSHDSIVNVTGDAMKERVLLYDHYLVVLGPRYRSNGELFWTDLAPAGTSLPMFEVRDLTGDGKAEIAIRKRIDVGGGWRELLQILGFDNSGAPVPVFEHETGISSATGTIQNDVTISNASKAEIKISIGAASGYSAANYHERTETAREPLLLPWGPVRSQTYVWDGSGFKKTAEQAQIVTSAPPPDSAPSGPAAPRPPTADELQDQVFALYKKDHHIASGEPPRFDFVTNVAEDEQNERIVCHGKDIVVFGKGFKQGRGYVSLGLSQFSDARDIVDVTAREFSGDGHSDIVVRGIQRAKAPDEMGSGEVLREVLFIYSVSSEGIARIFGTETAISVGDKRMQASIAFLPGANGIEIELRPGRSVGWDRRSWPYKQDTEAVSGVEPLLLPWTSEPVRYRFAGSTYHR
jgi:hypothetical protein